MIEVKNLTKYYGRHKAVDDLSFTFERGGVYGFLGPNGAGKSTTMNILTGCLAASEGTVVIDGHDILEDPIGAKRLIGYLPENPPLYPDMTPLEYLRFVGQAKGLRGKELKEQVELACKRTAIVDVSKRLIRHLSKGYKQRVGIAQAILGHPEFIILDEPTVGLDPSQIIEVRDLIKDISGDCTVILSTHIMQEVTAICDQVLIISKGKLLAYDTPENLSEKLMGSTRYVITVKADALRASDAIRAVQGVKNVSALETNGENATLRVECDTESDPKDDIFYALSDARFPIQSMEKQEMSLEDVFLSITGNPDAAPVLEAEETQTGEDAQAAEPEQKEEV